MIDLPAEFLARMKSFLGGAYEDFIKSYEKPAAKGVRVNTLKISKEEFLKISPLALGEEVPWANGGFYAEGEGLGKTALFSAGLYYVQEPSAMCAAPELYVKNGERVLDMCAAPGGKATQLAQEMAGEGLLVANEIDFKRSDILRGNIERLGVKNALVTCAPPEGIADAFPEFFNKILVDAPCSGEGMFKKEPNAVTEWSLENVRRCAERQQKILDCADRALGYGGKLVYSTCTFAPEEDERQVENFLKTHENYVLLSQKKLYPHEVTGEGHFCAVFEKRGGEVGELKAKCRPLTKGEGLKLLRAWEKETGIAPACTVYGDDTRLISFDGELPDFDYLKSKGVKIRACGVALNDTAVKNRFEPSHTLAMSLKRGECRAIDLDGETAIKYLRGQTCDCPADKKGWYLATYLGYPLGWCKAVGGIAKNHLPKGLRI